MNSLRNTTRRPAGLAVVLALAICIGQTGTLVAQQLVPRITLDGGIGWINTDRPIHLDKLRGKIIVLDFWTYCCINCHHVLPDLAKLEEKYKNQIVVIGVHTAKFPAERETENIRKKVREYNIKHPVVNDGNQTIWNRLGVSGWPTLAVLDVDGKPVYAESGEGQYEALDQVIGTLVKIHKEKGDLDETPVQFFAEREKEHKSGLLFPGKILADATGSRLFVSDTGHNRIVITDLEGKFQAAVGSGEEGLADGNYAQAKFNRPQGMCLVGDILYVADTESHAIRAIDLKAQTVSTVVGTGKQASFGTRSGTGKSASLNSPWDLVQLPGTRILAIAMAGPHQIWQLDLDTSSVRAWAGSGRENIVDGPLAQAALAQPSGLATDGKHLFIADSEVSGIRQIALGRPDIETGVQTVVGVGLFGFGDVDGTGAHVRLQHCLGLAFGGGKLYVADTYNNRIKTCDPAHKSVHAFVGSHAPGTKDDPAHFDEPGGLSVAGDELYVADTNNHAIRVVSLKTKKVRTLDISSIKAPVVKQVPTFANATAVDVPAAQVAPGKSFTITIKPTLEKGYELNEQAPLTYLVETPDKPLALSNENPTTGGKIDPPHSPFTVKVPLAETPKDGETLKVKVSLKAMVCLPNSLCTVKSFTWTVPVTFSAGGASDVKIGAK